jgi:N-acetylmuramoyl-L-alanine amidase
VVSFRAVKIPARVCGGLLLALLVVAGPAPAQQAGDEPPPVVLLASGTGTLALDGTADAPLPWIETPGGVLVEMAPLVARLGGGLTSGQLGASASLSIGGLELILVPGSAAVTRGTDILTLSQPVLEHEGRLYAPVDLIAHAWGEASGVTARWHGATRRLELIRPSSREIAVDFSHVHLQGVTTVAFRFAEAIRYRVDTRPGGIDLVAIGPRLAPAASRTFGDPWLRGLRFSGDRIRLDLAPGVEADDYVLTEPFRIVVDLFRAREPEAAETTPAPGPRSHRPGLRTIVLDPGHGGDETGTIGPAGTPEKELTLALARSLAERLRSELGVEVILTRNDDVTLALDERSAIANQRQADLFISIHLNATVRGQARGAETYFLALAATDARAAELASLENLTGNPAAAQPGSEEFDLQLLLWDLAQSRHLEASQRFATLVQAELNGALELPDRGVKQAPFRVLMGAAMPAVLVELGFLSNGEEEQKLRDPAYRTRLVDTLVRAVARFRSEISGAGAATAAGAAP